MVRKSKVGANSEVWNQDNAHFALSLLDSFKYELVCQHVSITT